MNEITMDTVRDLIERHSDHISGNTREFYNGAYAEKGGGEAMSMLGEQIKGLHEMAEAMHRRSHEIGLDYGMGRELANASRILREAADTIERLQELQGVASESRYTELFGTPERAARTLGIIADNLYSSTWSDDNATLSDVMCALVGKCDECVAQGLPGRGVTTKCGEVDYDALLEWLKQEVDA